MNDVGLFSGARLLNLASIRRGNYASRYSGLTIESIEGGFPAIDQEVGWRKWQWIRV
jgi:hypothetical protein